MPTLDDVLTYFRANRQRWEEQYGVQGVAVFGSLARGEAEEDSDIDVLVDMPEPTFRSYMDLLHELEDRFMRKVDLVLESGLKPRVRPYVEQEAVHA